MAGYPEISSRPGCGPQAISCGPDVLGVRAGILPIAAAVGRGEGPGKWRTVGIDLLAHEQDSGWTCCHAQRMEAAAGRGQTGVSSVPAGPARAVPALIEGHRCTLARRLGRGGEEPALPGAHRRIDRGSCAVKNRCRLKPEILAVAAGKGKNLPVPVAHQQPLVFPDSCQGDQVHARVGFSVKPDRLPGCPVVRRIGGPCALGGRRIDVQYRQDFLSAAHHFRQ
jgi:hypothetical protein